MHTFSRGVETTLRLSLAALLCSSCLLTLRAAHCQESAREWTDSSGTYHISATFEGRDGSKVKLRREDGKLIVMPLVKLSAEDQKYVKGLDGGNPFDEGVVDESSLNDSKARRREGSFTIGGKTIKLDGSDRKIFVGSFNKCNRLGTASSERAWEVKPSKRSTVPSTEFRNVAVFSQTYFGSCNLIYSHDSIFYVGYNSLGVGGVGKSGIARCDVAEGRCDQNELQFEAPTLFDVSSDSGRALTSIKINSNDPLIRPGAFLAIVDVGSFSPGSPLSPSAVFCPYYKPKENQFARDTFDEVEVAFFVDSNHIFTKCRSEATLWNLATCSAVYSIGLRGEELTVDPTRKYFALSNGAGMGFYDLATGSALGYVPIPADSAQGVGALSSALSSGAFSPNGEQFAFSLFRRVFIVDLTSGKLTHTLETSGGSTSLTWATDSHILAGFFCYELSSGAPIAYYLGLSDKASVRVNVGGRVWTICDNTTLTGLQLPHREALAAVEGKKIPDLFDVYPGMSVSIKCEFNGLLDENAAIEQVKKQLAFSGLKYDPKSETTVVLTARDTGETEKTTVQEVELERMSRLSILARERVVNAKTVELKVYEQSIALKVNGKDVAKRLYKTTGSNRGARDESKSFDEQIGESNKPELEFYGLAPLPSFVAKSDGREAATTAKVSSVGVEPVKLPRR